MSIPAFDLAPPIQIAPGLAPDILAARMAFLLRAAIARSPAIRDYRRYYVGDQPNALTDTQKTILDGLVSNAKPLADNQCRVIVDTVRSRLSVAGLNCKAQPVQDAIDQDWLLNGLTARQHDVHRNALRDGDSYALLGWNNRTRRVTVEPQQQWLDDGGDATGVGMHLAYDDDGEPLVAIKEWVQDVAPSVSRRRRTLYYPDRIERYVLGPLPGARDAIGQHIWQPFLLDGERQWPAPWLDRDGRPLGIPVVPFTNDTDATRYGVSELAGSILGLQRAHNDNLHSLLAAARMTGYQMMTATGVGEDEARNFKVGPGQVMGASNVAARIGYLPAGDLSQVKSALAETLQMIARNADLPIHAFTGQWPSGEALMRGEIALVARARVRQERFGRAWASLMHKATLLRVTFGREDLDTDALITARWDDAAMRDELFVIQLVNAKQQVMSNRQVLRELGYDEQTIDKIMRERSQDFAQGLALVSQPIKGSPTTPRDPATGDRITLPGQGG